MKIIKFSIQLLIIIAIAFALICMVHEKMKSEDRVMDESATDGLPSLEEVQERVGAKVDGIYGPETKRLWNKAICDKLAVEMIERQERIQ